MEDTESKSQYLKHLQSFNQGVGEVILSNDVKNDNGVLLATKGDRLSDKNVDLMIRHKLSKPLDSCIGLEPTLNAKLLRNSFNELFSQHKDIEKVVESSGAKPAISGCLHHMEQYSLVYQKLTIQAHVLPAHFKRGLLNSALALSLAVFSEQSKSDCIKIFFISLIENIGLLHIDCKVSENELPPFEVWRTYHAHPLIAKEVLKTIPGFPPSIIRGVAEHHERIDGTGFPTMAQGEKVSTYVHYTGLIDELTRLKFSQEAINEINLFELLKILQFRRQHFPSEVFSNLQSMISKAGLQAESMIQLEELKSFSRLQLYYYSMCMIYCDIVARIADSITSTTEIDSKKFIRLKTLSKNFIHGVFSSGMLSLPIREIIEQCIEEGSLDVIPDLIDIDHAHHGILDQIREIFLFLEFTVLHDNLSTEEKNSGAYASLQACLALLQHIQRMKGQELGWRSLIEEMYNGKNDLSAILESMK